MFADDEKNDLDAQESGESQPEKPEEEPLNQAATIIESSLSAEEPSAEREEEKAAGKPEEKKKAEGEGWITAGVPKAVPAARPAPSAAKPPAQAKAPSAAARPSTARPPEPAPAATGETGSNVPLGGLLSSIGINDSRWQIAVLVTTGLLVLCCVCSCLALFAASFAGN